MCRVPVAAAAPAHAPPPAWLDVAPVPPPLAPADDLPPLGEDDASMLDALLLGAGVKAEVKAEAPFFAAAPPPPYSAPSGPYALAGLYAAYGLEPSAVASLTHANAPGLAATAERGGRKGKRVRYGFWVVVIAGGLVAHDAARVRLPGHAWDGAGCLLTTWTGGGGWWRGGRRRGRSPPRRTRAGAQALFAPPPPTFRPPARQRHAPDTRGVSHSAHWRGGRVRKWGGSDRATLVSHLRAPAG